MDDHAQPMTSEQAERLIALIEKRVIRPQLEVRRRAGDAQ